MQKHDWLYFRMIFSWFKITYFKRENIHLQSTDFYWEGTSKPSVCLFLTKFSMTLTWKGSLSVCYPKPQKGRCVFEGLAPSPLVAHFDGLLNPEVGVENSVGGCSIGNGELTT